MLLRTATSTFFPAQEAPTPTKRCWFCGKSLREVKKMIEAQAPPGLMPCAICNECVGLCVEMLEKDDAS